MSSIISQISHAVDPGPQVALWIILNLCDAIGDSIRELWKACLCPLAIVSDVSWLLDYFNFDLGVG